VEATRQERQSRVEAPCLLLPALTEVFNHAWMTDDSQGCGPTSKYNLILCCDAHLLCTQLWIAFALALRYVTYFPTDCCSKQKCRPSIQAIRTMIADGGRDLQIPLRHFRAVKRIRRRKRRSMCHLKRVSTRSGPASPRKSLVKRL
jgi:hypothetical protein